MKFHHTETRPDFGGTITVTAENAAEVVELAEHFRMFDKSDPAQLVKLAEAITAGTLTYTSRPDAKRPWYLVESALDHEFSKPYLDLLERVTGYAGDLPNMDVTGHHPRRLCHTHHTVACELIHGHYQFAVLIQAEDWNGQPAQVRAERNAADYAGNDLGQRKQEREYIDAKNGSVVRNPNYLKHHPSRPGLGAPWLWAALFAWWRETHATAEQRAALAQADALKTAHKLDADYLLRFGGGEQAYLVGTGGMYLSYEPDVRFVKWEEFRSLGATPATV